MHTMLSEKGYVYNNNIIIDDQAGMTIDELMSKARKTNIDLINRTGQGLSLIVVDYLQLLSDYTVTSKRSSNREQESNS